MITTLLEYVSTGAFVIAAIIFAVWLARRAFK